MLWASGFAFLMTILSEAQGGILSSVEPPSQETVSSALTVDGECLLATASRHSHIECALNAHQRSARQYRPRWNWAIEAPETNDGSTYTHGSTYMKGVPGVESPDATGSLAASRAVQHGMTVPDGKAGLKTANEPEASSASTHVMAVSHPGTSAPSTISSQTASNSSSPIAPTENMTADCLLHDYKMWPTDSAFRWPTTLEPSAEDCQRRCQLTVGCDYFTFGNALLRRRLECTLIGNIGRQGVALRYVSGPKFCASLDNITNSSLLSSAKT